MAAGQGGSCWLVVTGTANPLPESALSLYAFRPTRGALCNELPPFVQCLCRGMPMRLWHSRGFRRPLSRATPMARANWAPCTSRGGARNEGQFIFWTRKAAEQGHALAQGNLGWAYEEGRGVGRDARWPQNGTARPIRAARDGGGRASGSPVQSGQYVSHGLGSAQR